MKLFLIAGEASGDSRGAELIRSLSAQQPGIEFSGLGGRQMRALSRDRIDDWCERAAVLGFIDVIKNYGYFRQRFNQTLEEIEKVQPDAIILIDYPGFNLRIAKALRKRNPAQRIIYYISPQVWAWNRGRIPQMAKALDLMICIFPFEKPLYEESGLKTEFVGHPMVDSLGAKRLDIPRDENLVVLLPGSRKREVKKIFPAMVEAAKLIASKRPQTRFAAAASSPEMEALMREILNEQGLECQLSLRNAHYLMQKACAGMVASGTATLEASFFRLPYVLIYKAAWLTFFVGRRLVKVQWLGIVNILAGKEVVREFLQEEARPEAIAAELLTLLNDNAARNRLLGETEKVIAQLGAPGASERAAAAILEQLRA
jgi:lipid-A-disaccharide synthase